jgi:hypothetical protein
MRRPVGQESAQALEKAEIAEENKFGFPSALFDFPSRRL